MATPEITVFAETNFRNQRRKFGIKLDDRRRHVYVVGKTGMGKSTLLENMVIADIRAGKGVAVVDPHGDLAEKVLDFIPNNRVNDVIYFNPSDTKFPIAFNILESIGDDYKHLVAYGLVGVFKKIWADSWGPRMEYIMTNTILALLEYPGSTLLGLMRMLVDKAYRKKVVAKVTDPVVKTFWADEYANYSEKFRTEAIAPIQNKVGQFLASAIIRNIVGQSKSTIEMREIMDNQKILIMNLAKGRIGEENSALLGAMMITKLQIAAMSRVDIPEPDRVDFYLYVDEFQNFATDSFAGILSEARKYRLCLIMAHQYFEQLGDVVKAAVFGNVGTMIVFRVGATDAAELELEFAPQFLPTDIVNLKKFTFCLRLMVDGVATEPFSAIGLPPATGATTNHEKVLKVSRERYARPQELVEDRIIRWSGVEINRPNQPAPDGSAAVVEDEDSEGDNMDWPDQVVTKSESTESNEDQLGTPVTKTTGVQLAAAATMQPSAYVNAAGFIPGDRASIPSVPVQVKPEVVQAEPEPLQQPQVQLDPEIEPTIPEAATRPRISFVNHRITESLQQPEDIGIAEDAEKIPEDAEIKETDQVVETEEEEDEEYEEETEEIQEPVKPIEQIPQRVQPKSIAPTTATTVPAISLQALKQGNVESVKFSDVKPIHELARGSMSSAQQPNGDQPRKRKRKRKRGGGGNSSQQQSQPLPQPPSQPQQPKPVQPQTSNPFASPAQPPQPRPPVQQQPPVPKPAASKPAPVNDPNKVSWGELLE